LPQEARFDAFTEPSKHHTLSSHRDCKLYKIGAPTGQAQAFRSSLGSATGKRVMARLSYSSQALADLERINDFLLPEGTDAVHWV